MAIDTAEKRRAITGTTYQTGPAVTPNASKDAEWRGEAGYGYPFVVAPVGGAVLMRLLKGLGL